MLFVNYASADHVAESVRLLADEPVASIRVLENGSGPEQVQRLREIAAREPRMTVSVSEQNLGFGGGVNRLVDELDCPAEDMIWILNPDTRVESGCIATLRDHLAENPRTIASPLILNYSGSVWFAGGGLSVKRGLSMHLLYGRPAAEAGTEPFRTTFMTGAAMAMTRSVWDSLGGFRDELFLYWEDSELSLRAHAKGVRLTVVPTAVISHLEGGSSSGGDGRSATFYYYYARNRLEVCSRYTSKLNLLVGAGIVETARGIVKPLVKEDTARLAKMRASLRGIAAGLRGESGPSFRR